jgi:hypothetical protein
VLKVLWFGRCRMNSASSRSTTSEFSLTGVAGVPSAAGGGCGGCGAAEHGPAGAPSLRVVGSGIAQHTDCRQLGIFGEPSRQRAEAELGPGHVRSTPLMQFHRT